MIGPCKEPPAEVDLEERPERLCKAEAYGHPRKVWVDDGHVFVEGHDGRLLSMTPEVAIKLGRMISDAGTESLINRVMEEAIEPGNPTRASLKST